MNYDNLDEVPIAAVVVFYNPDQSSVDNLFRIVDQMDFVVVVCNSIVDLTMFDLENKKNLEVIENCNNIGLGAALNQGIQRIFEAGFQFVTTFDQDTIILEGYRLELVRAYLILNRNHNIGIVAPDYIPEVVSKSAYNRNDEYFTITAAVQSGCLYTRECIESCGPFREDFFIESIDTEFCLRAGNLGYEIGCCRKPLMFHGAGRNIIKSFFGKNVVVTEHSIERVFLQYRNFSFVFKVYFWSNTSWAIKSFFSMTKKYILICLFETQRLNKSWAMVKGIYKGLSTKKIFKYNKIDL